MENLFLRAWKGQASLAQAFWLIYFLFGIILRLIVFIGMAYFVKNLFSPDVYPRYGNVMTTIVFPYTVYSAICVWRCAKNSTMIWNILAKIVVSLAVILGLLGIYGLIVQ